MFNRNLLIDIPVAPPVITTGPLNIDDVVTPLALFSYVTPSSSFVRGLWFVL